MAAAVVAAISGGAATSAVPMASALRAGAPGTSRSSSTSWLPLASRPSFSAAVYDTSTMRLEWNGPRSLIRTTTDCPLATLVMRAYDGIGSVGWAAVILYMSYGSPDEVRWPWNFLPYQVATPRCENGALFGIGR